jgi:hypothetical protein
MKKAATTQISHLEHKHQTLDAELDALMSQTYLTPQEYQQARELKKRKLLAKDSLTALRHAL